MNQSYPIALPEARSDTMAVLRHETFDIDTDSQLYAPDAIGINNETPTFKASVVAEIALPGNIRENDQHIAVLRLNRNDGTTEFALAGLQPDEQGDMKLNPGSVPMRIPFDEAGSAQLGRVSVFNNRLFPGVGFSEDVSRQHLVFNIDTRNRLSITDTSTNGTRIAAERRSDYQTVIINHDEPDYLAQHTQIGLREALKKGLLQEEQYFGNRKIIDRDTTDLEGKVDIRAWGCGGEAIVVDSESSPNAYQKLRDMLGNSIRGIERSTGRPATDVDIARSIHEVVVSSMEYDLDYVKEVSDSLKAEVNNEHRKINLAWYLEDGKGVCRQMALAAAWLGGEMVKTGRMTGSWTAEVNQRDTMSAHEWARYTAGDGEVYIADPAQEFFGTLAESARKSPVGERWNYFRLEERQRYMAAYAGRVLRQTRPHKIIDEIPQFN